MYILFSWVAFVSMASQDTEYFSHCAGDNLDGECFGFVHPLGPHYICFIYLSNVGQGYNAMKVVCGIIRLGLIIPIF